MSCLTTLMHDCPNLQDALNKYWPTCGAQMFKEPIPFLEFLASTTNTNGIKQQVAPGSGKVRTINLTYRKRRTEAALEHNKARDVCTSDNKSGDCIVSYTIDPDQNIQSDESIGENQLNRACIDNPTYFMDTLMMMIDQVERGAATQVAAQAIDLAGSYATDVTGSGGAAIASGELVVKTKKDSSIDLYPDTMQTIDLAFLKTGYCGDYATFSGDLLFQYYRNLLTGCCTDSGLDLSKQFSQYGKAVVYDRRVAAALAADNGLSASQTALVVMRGALQLLEYNQFDWKNNLDPIFKQGQNYWTTILTSPRSGIQMDFKISDNCGNVSMFLTWTGKVVGMPLDMFPSGDVYEGVNYVNKIRVVNVP